MLAIGLLVAFDIIVVGGAVVLAIARPDDPWRISVVMMLLLTILMGATADPRAFLLTGGLVIAFGTGRATHRLRQHRSSRDCQG
ncbi:hypothetical protein [Saccharopolyspora mangrovi]|uniref:Uncharacterized protein n=1 Tax=Saccharopolyspora mangrovi TaxID=3082379 RepID=A0ABU6AJQ1_9PSEU|nr:hypothetical protein [Saccharopolyspora sp. S2-29]MEB3371783.1 hypothetical protein [Saccharopolyspora sp. S2-29]